MLTNKEYLPVHCLGPLLDVAAVLADSVALLVEFSAQLVPTNKVKVSRNLPLQSEPAVLLLASGSVAFAPVVSLVEFAVASAALIRSRIWS